MQIRLACSSTGEGAACIDSQIGEDVRSLQTLAFKISNHSDLLTNHFHCMGMACMVPDFKTMFRAEYCQIL